jgi:adenosylhomocysteinase
MESKIADITLADYGRKDIELSSVEMPGLMSIQEQYKNSKPFENMKITGSLHMTIQTAILIETLKDLGADIRWCSCNIYSTQDHAAAAIVKNDSAKVFAWKGETLTEYWECTYNALVWPDNTGPDLIVDDGSDATMLIHEGVKYEEIYNTTKIMPDFGVLDLVNNEFHNVLNIIKKTLEINPMLWTNISNKIIGVSEETTTGVQRLIELANNKKLLFPAINVNDAVTKAKFDNLYGCKHSLVDALNRSTDVMIAGKKALVCGYGDVGKGSVESLKSAGAIVYVTEIDPICALQAYMNGLDVVQIEDVLSTVDIFVTATGNKDIILIEHMEKMKNNAIVCNIGHFDNEIDVLSLTNYKDIVHQNIKPQVDRFVFPNGNGIILLAMGRLVNLGCATGHPSFVMSCSFTNQVLAQLELCKNKENYEKKVYNLPRILDEEVARLHLDKLGCKLTKLTNEQSIYIGKNINGPFKSDDYKY